MYRVKLSLMLVLLGVFLVSCQKEKSIDAAIPSEEIVSEEVTPTPEPTAVPTPEPTPEPVDTTPPVIEGAQDITIYLGDTVSYKKGIVLSDDSGETPGLEIDNSQVNLAATGTYPVVYKATDSSGNVATVEIVLQIIEQPTADEIEVTQLADELIAELTTPEMSDWDKAYALWNWCRTSIRYSTSAGDRTSVWTGAYEGLHDKSGDCYAYYAAYTVLLNRCGIENMCITRVGGNSNHWWTLVNLGDGWYHCDPSPRRKGDSYKCFMQTDAQVQAYTESYPEHPNYYTFDASLYPERETEIIFGKEPADIAQ